MNTLLSLHLCASGFCELGEFAYIIVLGVDCESLLGLQVLNFVTFCETTLQALPMTSQNLRVLC